MRRSAWRILSAQEFRYLWIRTCSKGTDRRLPAVRSAAPPPLKLRRASPSKTAVKAEQHSLVFRHWAGIGTYTSDYSLAGTCVFSKQSPRPGHCDPGAVARTGAPLLPKLRGQVAEFLNEGSPERLRILSSPTCVGLRYGHRGWPSGAFLGGSALPGALPNVPRLGLPASPRRHQ